MTAALEVGEWSAASSGRTLPPGKDPIPILQEVGWTPGSVWTGGKSHPHGDSIPDRPARSCIIILDNDNDDDNNTFGINARTM